MQIQNSRHFNLILADDHPIVIEGLSRSLEKMKNIRILDRVKNGEELLESKKLKECDLAILDIMMPRMDGFEVTKKLLVRYPELKILIFSMYSSAENFRKSISLGAKGFIYKRDHPDILLAAVTSILEGNFGISPSVSPILRPVEKSSQNSIYTGAFNRLTNREKEILSYAAKERPYSEIADLLKIETDTVAKHMQKIRKKIHPLSATEVFFLSGNF